MWYTVKGYAEAMPSVCIYCYVFLLAILKSSWLSYNFEAVSFTAAQAV